MQKIKKAVFIILFIAILIPNLSIEVYAANGVAYIEAFDNLSGDARYLGEDYRDNYYLDIEKLGVLDTGYQIMNSLANVLFGFICTIAYITVALFYFSMDFDVASLMEPQISMIQQALNSGIFKPLFLLAFCGTMLNVAVRFWHRDLAGIGAEFAKVLGVIVLSIFVIRDSATAISYATNITKGLSVSILNGVNESYGVSESGTGYAAQASGILWINLVHEPWKTLQFGSDVPSDEVIEGFLKKEPGEEERQRLVDEFSTESTSCFDKSRGSARIGFCLAYLIPFIMKCGIYLVMSLVQIVFQLLAVFFVLLAAVILILALIPGYGMDIVSIWLKKMLETQISILIISFLMALLIRIDELLYALAPNMGWFPILIFQVGIGVGLFMFRNKILGAFSNIQKSVQNPGRAKYMLQHSGNPYETTERLRRSAVNAIEAARKPDSVFSRFSSVAATAITIKNFEERPVTSSGRATPVNQEVKRPQTTERSNYSEESWDYIAKTCIRPVASQRLQSGSGTAVVRPVTSRETASGTPVARPVTGKDSASGTPAARPVTGKDSASGTPVARPVTGKDSASGTPAARPVTGKDSASGTPAARPVTGKETAASGTSVARPVMNQSKKYGTGVSMARSVNRKDQK